MDQDGAQSGNHDTNGASVNEVAAAAATSLDTTTIDGVVTGKTAQKNKLVRSCEDFGTEAIVAKHVKSLTQQCQLSDAAAIIIPWFCRALRSPSSRRDYYAQLRRFFTAIRESGKHPYDVAQADIALYLEALEQAGLKPASVAQALTVIRRCYEEFGKAGAVPWPTVHSIQAVSGRRVERNTTPQLTLDEACKMLDAPDRSTMKGLRDFALLFTYFKTAARSSAIRMATVGSVERSDSEWYIVVTEKRGKTRRLALLEAAPAVLQWIDVAGIAHDPSYPLFPALERDRKTPSNRHLSSRAILKIVKQYAQQVGLQVDRLNRRGICTHSLRKTAAMDALEHGANIKEVQAYLGHEDIRTTQNYITYKEDDAENAARHNQIRPKDRA